MHPILLNVTAKLPDEGPCWDWAGCAIDYCRERNMLELAVLVAKNNDTYRK
jgi:hypothetical protein